MGPLFCLYRPSSPHMLSFLSQLIHSARCSSRLISLVHLLTCLPIPVMVIHAGHVRALICLISPTQAMPPYFPFPSSTKATCGPFSVSVVHPVHVRSHFCHNLSIQPVAPFVSDLPRALAHVLANSGNGHPCWPCACLVLSDLTHPGLPFFSLVHQGHM